MDSTNCDLKFDLNYFTKRQGLRGFGLSMRRLQESDVSTQQIVDYLGPRFDKNGWKILPSRVTAEVQLSITDLYRRVFRRGHIVNDTISLEFARGIVAEANDKKINWAEYAVYVNSKRHKLEVSRKNRTLQLGVLQKRVLSRPPSGNLEGAPHLSTVSRHLPGGFSGVGEDSDLTSVVFTKQLSEGASVFQEPAPIHRSISHSHSTLTEVDRAGSAKQSVAKSKMECNSSSKRGTKLSGRRSVSISGMVCHSEALSKTVDRVQALLLQKQSSFLGSNKCIADFCEEHFDPIWRLSFGFAEPPKQESSRDVIHDRLCSGGIQSGTGTSSSRPLTSKEEAQHLQSDQGNSFVQSQSTFSETARSAREDFKDDQPTLDCSSCKRSDDIMVSLQPCGHFGVCKKCAGEILFCPTCSEIIESFRDPKLIAPLRPLSFGDAFNSAIQPDVEMHSEKARRKKSINSSMEIFGGREPEIPSESEDSSEDEETILNTPAPTVFGKPKRACASDPYVETSEGLCSVGQLRDDDNCDGKDDDNHELSLLETTSQHDKGSAMLDIHYPTNPSLLNEEGNTEDTPVAENDGLISHTSTGFEIERVPNCGNKRRNIAESQSPHKRVLRNHSKPSKAKEVLRLLADQRTQAESSAALRVRRDLMLGMQKAVVLKLVKIAACSRECVLNMSVSMHEQWWMEKKMYCSILSTCCKASPIYFFSINKSVQERGPITAPWYRALRLTAAGLELISSPSFYMDVPCALP